MEQFANFAASTLTAAYTAGGETLAVASTASFPQSGNFRVTIDTEIMLVTVASGTALTIVTYGLEGTANANHASGASVSNKLTAGSLVQAVVDRLNSDNIAGLGTAATYAAAAFDAAGAASAAAAVSVPLATVEAPGDLIVGTGSGAVARLAQGGEGNALGVAAGTVAWVAALLPDSDGVVTMPDSFGAQLVFPGGTINTAPSIQLGADNCGIYQTNVLGQNGLILCSANTDAIGVMAGIGVVTPYGYQFATQIWSGTVDVGLWRHAAGVIEVNNGTVGQYRDLLLRSAICNGVTFSNAVSAPAVGTVQCFTDSTSDSYGATVTGAGSNKVLAWYNGANWIVLGGASGGASLPLTLTAGDQDTVLKDSEGNSLISGSGAPNQIELVGGGAVVSANGIQLNEGSLVVVNGAITASASFAVWGRPAPSGIPTLALANVSGSGDDDDINSNFAAILALLQSYGLSA